MNIHNKFYIKKFRGSYIQIGNNFTFLSGDCLNPLSRNITGCLYTQFSASEIVIGNNIGLSSVYGVKHEFLSGIM